MHAGTIGLLESPAEEPLESWAAGDARPPALDVLSSQDSLDGEGLTQEGLAAGRVEQSTKLINVVSGPEIKISRDKTNSTVATPWVADVTGPGLIVAESVAGDDPVYPFPFDLFMARCGSTCNRQQLDIEALGNQWKADGVLSDVWMRQDRDDRGVNIRYHKTHPDDAERANIGLGFERTYQGSVARGVCYESGYVAIWRDWTASTFLSFVEDELLPYAETYEEDEDDQTDFEDFG